MRILLVEDDELIGSGLRTELIQNGYAVDWLKDGSVAEQAFNTQDFELVILDIGLPGKTGLELLKSIRARKNKVPVIFLTARDTLEDRIEGLDSGADDYITKPFDLNEVTARIRAIQRRSSGQAETKITVGNISLDTASHNVTLNGQPINLARREFALLQKLIENAGRVMSRDVLAKSLYSWSEDVDSNTLEVHIHNLRKKIGSDIVKTIRGVGYIIEKTEDNE